MFQRIYFLLTFNMWVPFVKDWLLIWLLLLSLVNFILLINFFGLNIFNRSIAFNFFDFGRHVIRCIPKWCSIYWTRLYLIILAVLIWSALYGILSLKYILIFIFLGHRRMLRLMNLLSIFFKSFICSWVYRRSIW